MKIINLVVSIMLALVFVISTVTVLFSAGRVVNAGLDAYVFKIDNCYGPRYLPTEVGEGEKEVPEQPECFIDYNQAKRDVSGGLALLVVAAPLAYFSYRKSLSLVREGKEGK
ncbi:MAG: hypothetical protein WD883_02440 [Candidatus Colwellbacteria bacterium]